MSTFDPDYEFDDAFQSSLDDENFTMDMNNLQDVMIDDGLAFPKPKSQYARFIILTVVGIIIAIILFLLATYTSLIDKAGFKAIIIISFCLSFFFSMIYIYGKGPKLKSVSLALILITFANSIISGILLLLFVK